MQRKIGSPRAQSEYCSEIQYQPENNADAWARMLSELSIVENVTIIPIDENAEHIRICWNPLESMAWAGGVFTGTKKRPN